MLGIRVTLDPSTQATFDRLDRKVADAGVLDGARMFTAQLLGEVKSNTPGTGPGRTGTLRRAWNAKVDDGADMIQASVFNPLERASYVEFGTGIFGPLHKKITPKTGKVLAFHWGKGAAVATRMAQRPSARRVGKARMAAYDATLMFRASVKGMKAQPMFKPAFEKVAPKLSQIFGEALEAAMLGGG